MRSFWRIVRKSKKMERSTAFAEPRAFAEPLESRQLLTSIVSGQTIYGAITASGQKVTYTFNATGKQSFEVSLGAANATSTFLPYFQLYNPSGVDIDDESNFNSHSSAKTTIGNDTAGTYTIVVQSESNSGLGAYALELDAGPASQAADADGDGGVSITSGQTKTGTMNRPGDMDVYTFNASGKQTFEVSLGAADATNSPFLPFFELYDPNGIHIDDESNFNSHSSAKTTIGNDTAGTYTIVVQSESNSGLGAYALELDAGPASQAADADGDGGVSITSGQTKTGTMNRPGDMDVYTFNASGKQTFEVSLGAADATNSPFLPFFELYDPNGIHIDDESNFNSHSSAKTTIGNDTAGTYTIVVQSESNSGLGAYALELDAGPASQAADADGDGGRLLTGGPRTGTISRPGDIDVFTFNADYGDIFKCALVGSSGFQPAIKLIDPAGIVLDDDSSATANSTINESCNVASGKSGPYTIIVQDETSAGTGGYSISVTGNVTLALASLSADVYQDPIARTGYINEGFLPLASDSDSKNDGYAAEAYVDSGGAQIAISFRGTVPTLGPALIKDLAADESFLAGIASPLLIEQVADASLFVASIHAAHPQSQILLTGHSLGGAIAQVLGKTSGLKTYGFNAPGTGSLYRQLAPYASAISGIGSDGTNIDYRLYGDQVSLAGTSLASTITIAGPASDVYVPFFPGTLKDVVANCGTFLDLHSHDTVISQINANALQKSTSGEPNDVAAIEAAISPIGVFKAVETGNYIYALGFSVTAGVQVAGILLDPPTGSDFTLTSTPASPAINSVLLPNLQNVSSYNVRYLVGTTWTTYQNVLPATVFNISQGTHSIEFLPLDSKGSAVSVADSFFFDPTFASTGTFSGFLSTSASVSLPPGLSLGTGAYAELSGNTLTVDNGSVTFTADARTISTGINIVASYASNVIFATTQHLGSLTLNDTSTAIVASNGNNVLGVTGLTLAPMAKLDLTNNTLIDDYTGASPAATVLSNLKTGRAGGTWNGASGITSSAVASVTNSVLGYGEASAILGASGGTFAGQTVDATSLLVRFTLLGDANLDRKVDVVDLGSLSSNWQKAGGWAQGDFNYDNLVDVIDLGSLSSDWQQTYVPTSPAAATPNGGVIAPPKKRTASLL